MKDLTSEAMFASEGQGNLGLMASVGLMRGVMPQAANVNAPFEHTESHLDQSDTWYCTAGKRWLDICLVLISLPVTLPLIALSALVLWIESGRPFYRQTRLGGSGKLFPIYKLRTMIRDADAVFETMLQENPALKKEWDETQKIKEDPRITRVGKLLRRTSMDELPQLFNVLRGDMSLVGPRPMMPEQLPLYRTPAAYFALKPGLTGVWQVSARNEEGFAQRARLDADYARQVCLWWDVVLIAKTIGVILRRTGY